MLPAILPVNHQTTPQQTACVYEFISPYPQQPQWFTQSSYYHQAMPVQHTPEVHTKYGVISSDAFIQEEHISPNHVTQMSSSTMVSTTSQGIRNYGYTMMEPNSGTVTSFSPPIIQHYTDNKAISTTPDVNHVTPTSSLRHRLCLPSIRTTSDMAKNVMSEECDLGYYSFEDLSPLPEVTDRLTDLSAEDNVFHRDVKSNFSDIIDGVLDSMDDNTYVTVNDVDQMLKNTCNDSLLVSATVGHSVFNIKPEPSVESNLLENFRRENEFQHQTTLQFTPYLPLYVHTETHALNDNAKNDHSLISTIPISKLDNFTCQMCNQAFRTKTDLKVHFRQHKGERSHQCQYCEKAFAQKSTLRTHERTHTGIKPFVCVYCARAFSDYSTYRKHLRIHTGEKPYVCDVCKKSFTQSGNMIRHRDVHFKQNKKHDSPP